MDEQTSVDFLLAHAQPGQAMLGRFDIDEGPVSAVIIREDAATAAQLSEEPTIYVRSGALLEQAAGGEVIVCVILAYVEGVDSVYETWLNFHNPAHRPSFDDLARQQKLLFRFYVDSAEPLRTVYLPNPFADFATQIATHAASMAPWSMEQFNLAMAAVQMRNPEPHLLWDTFTPEGDQSFAEMQSSMVASAPASLPAEEPAAATPAEEPAAATPAEEPAAATPAEEPVPVSPPAEETVPCPACGKGIPGVAVACPYCGSRVQIGRTGYCPDCRAVVAVSNAGTCALCGSQTHDVRVEGSVVTTPEPAPPAPAPGPQPAAIPVAAVPAMPQSSPTPQVAVPSAPPAGSSASPYGDFILKPHGGAARTYRNVRARVEPGTLRFWADRLTSQGRTIMLVAKLVAIVPLVLALVVALTNPDMTIDHPLAAVAGGLLLLGILGTIALGFVQGYVWRKRVESVDVAVPLSAITRAKTGMNWDWGCGFAILLTPLIAIIYLLVAGANVVTLTAPLDASRGAQMHKFRPAGGKELARRFVSAIEIERARA